MPTARMSTSCSARPTRSCRRPGPRTAAHSPMFPSTAGLAAIYVQTLSTGAQVQVSAKSGINGAPSFSPDGKQLALALSRRDGNVDVYVLTLGTQELQRLTERSVDRYRAGLGDGRPIHLFHVGPCRRAAGLQRRARVRRARAPRHLRRQLQRESACFAGWAPACGRHSRPRGLPHRFRRRPAAAGCRC